MTIVAQFQIPYTRFIDPQGKLTQELPLFAKDPQTLQELYRWMVLLRAYDTKAVALQRTGKIGTYASTLGQEAIGIGIGHAMHKEDVLCPAYREYGIMIQRGIKFSEILLYWGGDERGSCYANNKNDFPICVPIATQCLHAAGAARAFQLRQEDRVAVAVIGDGGTSQGDFYEAMNIAGVWKLPVIFIINNNQWAISVPRQKQTGAPTLAQKGLAAGLHCEQTDGNDVIAVRNAVERALQRARNKQGASLIEAVTYRLCDHTTADDASRYWDKKVVEVAWKEEPILRLRTYLMKNNLWDEEKEKRLQDDVTQQVATALKEFLDTPLPAPEAMFDYLYEKLPDALAEQYLDVLEFGVTQHH